MTCRYTNTDWLDVLYNCVRRTPGGVIDAAKFLTERRGKSIHPESLRAKLKRSEGDPISVEMAMLLSEWMDEKAGGAEYSRDWLLAVAAEEGLAVDVVPLDEPAHIPEDIAALQTKVMQIAAKAGGVAGLTAETVADGVVTQKEADELVEFLRDLRTLAHRAERNVLRAVEKRD